MKPDDPSTRGVLFKIRVVLGFFMLGLLLSGVTAFPLQSELDLIARWFDLAKVANAGGSLSSSAAWVLKVREALDVTYARYPFVAYGTDWLAFGHIVIALFFIGPLFNPVKNIAVLYTGMWACLLVLPLALICGPIRGVPFFWRLIDCSFGVLGFPFLWYCTRLVNRLPPSDLTGRSGDR